MHRPRFGGVFVDGHHRGGESASDCGGKAGDQHDPDRHGIWGGEGLVESGVVASFARPGGNITGIYMLAAELDAKRFELLLEALPNARRLGVLNPGDGWTFTEVRQAARAAGIQLHITAPPGPEGYDRIFDTMARARVDAVLVLSFPRFNYEHPRIIEAAAKRRIPAMYEWGEIARDGGLLAYGPVIAELNRRVAIYVDRILKGANPGDLPVEQPTKFEFVVNLKTAKALGLTIPQSILARRRRGNSMNIERSFAACCWLRTRYCAPPRAGWRNPQSSTLAAAGVPRRGRDRGRGPAALFRA